MSFRTCPACKASVLEDDAELCPFCGASMSGKPTPAAKAAAPTAPAKKPASGSAAKPAGKAAAAKAPAGSGTSAKRPAAAEEAADSGDPFDVDTAAMRKAFRVQPRPKKGCMVRVVCPMCDTPGFIPEKQQGKDVKCCNPECLVPVYTAPEPEPEEPEDEAPAANWTTRIFWGVAGTALVAGLITVYMVVFNAEVEEIDPRAIPPVAGNNDGENDLLDDLAGGRTKPEVVVEPPVTPAEIRDEALPEMVKAAQQRDNNRSKPFGRQQAAEAYALVGDLPKARQQLTRLADVGKTVPFYRIGPLVRIAGQQRKAGDLAGANATLDKAVAVASFPRVGRQPLDAVGNLAAALVINDRLDDAKRLVTGHSAGGSRGELSAMWQGALDLK
ncbi:MAG: tetratricopeptide repeat protein, partial [Maioricimonas sp. JB049]